MALEALSADEDNVEHLRRGVSDPEMPWRKYKKAGFLPLMLKPRTDLYW